MEQLEQHVGATQAEAHLGPAPNADGEEANVWYFAFGSNINKKVFEGRRRISPAESVPAVLPGWRLEFSQPGLPYAEPAFAAVEPQPEEVEDAAASSGGARQPDVHGVAHRITPSQWAYVLETEGGSGGKEDHAYKVVEATAVDYSGRELVVLTLTVSPKIKARLQGRHALPSLRYLTLIRDGAKDYGLTPEYQAWLATLRHYTAERPGQKLGGVVFRALALTFIFPVWAGVRLLRRVTGMKSANDDMASRWMRRYTAALFRVVLGLHELVAPVLGCGMTSSGSSPTPPRQ